MNLCKTINKFNFKQNSIYAMDGGLFSNLLKLKYSDICTPYIKDAIDHLILDKCMVFARMTPNMKADLVNELKKDEESVLMCGDGSNDCAALKAANVGVSLSTEDASIAAPFTSLVTNISSVKTVIMEGKHSLVTSIQIFKLMFCYSIVILIGGTINLYHGSYYVAPVAWILPEILVVLCYAISIPMIPSYEPLTYGIPKRNLFCAKNLSVLLAHVVVFAFF
jgi:cation-transporting ATPase 13A2